MNAKNLFLMPAMMAALGMMLVGSVTAQNFTNLYSFSAEFQDFDSYLYTNSDGIGPNVFILSGDTLYGAASLGGANGNGTVFAVNTDGTGFTILHSFTATPDVSPYTNSDGVGPTGLILAGDTLYGTARAGGVNGNGTVFAINTNGTGFTILHTFTTNGYTTTPWRTNSDGAGPNGGLILAGTTLFGTAYGGGANGSGTVFAVSTDGLNFKTLHTFSTANTYYGINSDGAQPSGGLVLSGDILYGTASIGGANDCGTVFALNTDGSGFTTLYNFSTPVSACLTATNDDGAGPYGSLVLASDTLYGVANGGGANGYGTVFAVNTDGSDFTTLHSFAAIPNIGCFLILNYTNSDGAGPLKGLVLSGDTLYGTAPRAGINGSGTMFTVNTDGTGFSILHSFTTNTGTNSDGVGPGGLILAFNNLYGTAGAGVNGSGTVFKFDLIPTLGIIQAGNQVILSWPSWAQNYSLEATTNLASADWTAVSPDPVIVNEQNTVTNTIVGTQRFYRLSQ